MNRTSVSGEDVATQPKLRELVLYFFRLGALGFGGPIALVGYMQRDLVEDKKWVSREDYFEGLAFSQLCPGPLAAQLAKYLGWIHSWNSGSKSHWFSLHSALVPDGLGTRLTLRPIRSAHLDSGSLLWDWRGSRRAYRAQRMQTNSEDARTDYLLWVLFAALAITTVWTQSEIVWLFLLFGFVAMFVRALPKWSLQSARTALVGPGLSTGLLGSVSGATVASVFLSFLKAGAFVFGSGLAIVPFLYGGVVGDFIG
jgi:chromate transporter